MSATLEEAVLSWLRRGLSEPGAVLSERAQLVAGLKQLSQQLAAPPLSGLADEVDKAADGAALSVCAAKGMRLLMQAMAEASPEPEAAEQQAPTDRRERRRRTLERKQRRALEAARADTDGSPLDRPIETLPGIGKVSGQALRARGLETVGDMVWLLPLAYRDERQLTPFSALRDGEHAVTVGRVVSVRGGGGYGRAARMAEVVLRDETLTELRLVWFRAPGGLLARFVEGSRFRVSGRVEVFRGRLGINHPTTERVPDVGEVHGPGLLPRYPDVPGVGPRVLERALRAALERAVGYVVDAVPDPLRAADGLPSLSEALCQLHAPPQDLSEADLATWNAHASPAHRRLAYEEFFLLELALHHRRVIEQGVQAEALIAPAAPLARVRGALGFPLTSAQARVVDEIATDLASPTPMRRLLQGDVGSGKTAVALLSAAHAVAAGAQVAFMAPTEVLAEQHFRGLLPLSEALGLRTALLLGGARASHRRKVLAGLSEGRIDLVVGTHALLSEGVGFARLRLVIVDEQHRFGVAQRLRLVDKGQGVSPHLLVMTATPIPRTLTLALHGDLSASVLDEMPPGRVPAVTRAYPLDQRDKALRQLERALESGGQAYVVCPAIEASEEQPLRTVEEAYQELSERFAKWGVGLLHGRLPAEDKQRAMDRFISGETRVLVATTVIEVGVDVPSANAILIEHAERFGMAQLHQLRGRVGRGGQRSACLLVHEAAGEDSRKRIEVLCETHDGFRIAEEDLRLRGPGELFGRRQSGLPGFRFGDLRRDMALLERARTCARDLMQRDPELADPEHAPARVALERMQDSRHAVVKEEAG